MVFAGDEYRKKQFFLHALKCYYVAYCIYEGNNWQHLSMHLLHMLGRFSFHLELYVEAVHFFLELIKVPKLISQEDDFQQKIISELLATLSKWTQMPIPPENNPITGNCF